MDSDDGHVKIMKNSLCRRNERLIVRGIEYVFIRAIENGQDITHVQILTGVKLF